MVTRGKDDPLTLAYVAGIIDGEGHIGIDRTNVTNALSSQRRKSVRYQGTVCVVNSDKKLIDFLVNTFGGNVGERRLEKKHHKQTYRWKVTNQKGCEFLELIEPYLMLKKKQAQLVIELVRGELPRTYGKGAKVPEEENERREQIYQQLKQVIDDRRPQRLTEEDSTQP